MRSHTHALRLGRRFEAAAVPHLAVDHRNSLDFVRGLYYSTPGLRWGESTQAVLGCCWRHNKAEVERRYIELERGPLVSPLPPNPYHGRASDQSDDVGVL